MKLFRIRNKATGGFSIGGARPKWSKQGKRWDSLAGVRAHLKIVENFWADSNPQKAQDYFDASEVVEYDVHEVSTTPASSVKD